MRRESILFFGCILAMVLILLSFSEARQPFSSAEVKFTDRSAGGLAIMPASCPSDPHWAGECSAPEGSCTIEIAPTVIASGGGTLQIVWTTGAYDQSSYTAGGTINSLGAVYPYGNLEIAAPNVTTTYTYNGNYYDTNGTPVSSYSCSATLTVTEPQPTVDLYINKVELYRNPGEPVAPGDIISYRMYIRNSGTADQNWLDVHDHIPTYTKLAWQGGGTDYNSSGQIAGGVDGNGDIWWQQQYAPALWSGYVDFNVRVDADAPNGAQICNAARISSQEIGAKPSNTVCNPVAVDLLPDLLTDAPRIYNGSAVRGGTITLVATVGNFGMGNITATFANSFTVDLGNDGVWDFWIDNDSDMIGLSGRTDVGNNTRLSTGVWSNLPVGTHAVRLCADMAQKNGWASLVSESNEGNNCGPNLVFTVPSDDVVWTPYCTGGDDINGNDWQWWEYDDSTPRNYRYLRPGDGECTPPAKPMPGPLSASCAADNRSVTLSWSAGTNANMYFPNMYLPSTSACPAGWTHNWTSGDGTLIGCLYEIGTTRTSISAAIPPDTQINASLYVGNTTTGQYNWIDHTTTTFKCSDTGNALFDLKINGSDNPLPVEPGETFYYTWTSQDVQWCVPHPSITSGDPFWDQEYLGQQIILGGHVSLPLNWGDASAYGTTGIQNVLYEDGTYNYAAQCLPVGATAAQARFLAGAYGSQLAQSGLLYDSVPVTVRIACPEGEVNQGGQCVELGRACTLTATPSSLPAPGSVTLRVSVDWSLFNQYTSWSGWLTDVGLVDSAGNAGPWTVWADSSKTYTLDGESFWYSFPAGDLACSTAVTVGGSCTLRCDDGSIPPACNLDNCIDDPPRCESTPVTRSCSPSGKTVITTFGTCGDFRRDCAYFDYGYGCIENGSEASCSAPTLPDITFTVTPQLVHAGDSATAAWIVDGSGPSTDEDLYCTVTGPAGVLASGVVAPGASRSVSTGPIGGQSVFTLDCRGTIPDATTNRYPSLPSISKTVSLIPQFQEI